MGDATSDRSGQRFNAGAQADSSIESRNLDEDSIVAFQNGHVHVVGKASR